MKVAYLLLFKALASHQCGPDSIPGVVVICGLSSFVVSSRPCYEDFSPSPLVFSTSSKTKTSKFQFDTVCNLEYI